MNELVFMYNYLYESEVVYKMKLVQGVITAPIGYFATGVASGIKRQSTGCQLYVRRYSVAAGYSLKIRLKAIHCN